MKESFFSLYLRYANAGVSEPPITYHRWTALSILGGLLGRGFYLPFGHSQVYPNQYINLMGAPGTRKSTAINIGTKLLRASGFSRFAADRVSKEMFLAAMQQHDDDLEVDDLLTLTLEEPSECFIAAEEFTDFIGIGNIEFVTMLTKLWDNPAEYTHPKLHGKSIEVHQPTINLLAGNTIQNFALAFPPEALGNGFMSRCLFIHGDTTGRKVTFPPKPDELARATLVEMMKEIKNVCKGEAIIAPAAEQVFQKLYEGFADIPDHRFTHYSTRRFTHLLKLSLIMAASKLQKTITEREVLEANTVLHWAECRMPKALGEYGRSKTAPQSEAVLSYLNRCVAPQSPQDIWRATRQDFAKFPDLLEVIKGLVIAQKIELAKVGKAQGYVPVHVLHKEWDKDLIIEDYLTQEEMSGL